MKTLKVTSAQHKALQVLTRKDLNTLKKHPKIVAAGRALLKACRKVVKHVEAIPQYANSRKRQTAYKRIIKVCQKAIEAAEK
ncbi:MAG TPA: hypothetical protein VMK05_03960 [Burkholderiales bacterium]|nr:hypothetical protein [Burkholderiales bacterium]